MKGAGFYGLRAKQFSLVLIVLVCSTIIFWAWEKTPLLNSILPPRSHVLQLSPDIVNNTHSQEEKNISRQTGQSLDIAVSVDFLDTGFSTSGKGSKNSSRSREKFQEVPTVNIEDSNNDEAFEGKRSPKQADAEVSAINIEDTNNNQTEGKNSSKRADSLIPDTSMMAEVNNKSAIPVKKACNHVKGKWVMDDNRPLYSGFGCKQWLSPMWACRLTQRTDFDYEKLRWMPKDCQMEEFTGPKFLERMQNKTLAFIGDSLGRQQFQSLMCMITAGQESPSTLDVGHEYGLIKALGAARPDGWAYRFPATNTTVLYYWSASLCDIQPLDPSNLATDYAMHLDRPPSFLSRFLHKFDVLILNTGHHWNRGKLKANRWIMYVGGVPNTNRKIADIYGAKNFTIYSVVKWVGSQLPKYPGLRAFYRSISPRHFFNGDWNTGGTCDNTAPLLGGKEVLQEESSDGLAAGAVKGTGVKLLDITAISQLRDEGHISRYSIRATPGVQDCLHWCLPGVPDTWNELLFAQL